MAEPAPDVSERATVPFTRALGAIAVAPLVGTAILSAPALSAGPAFLFMLLYVAPWAYGTAAVFVLPILAVCPASRRPSSPVAAACGAVAACCGFAVLGLQPPSGMHLTWELAWMSLRDMFSWGLIWAIVPGTLSGMLYAWLVRRREGH